MIDHDHVTIAIAIPASENNHAGISCINRHPGAGSDINRQVAGPEVITGEIVIIRRPDEEARAAVIGFTFDE